MIYLLDNGQAYEDQQVLFVHAPSLAGMASFLVAHAARGGFRGAPELLGVAEEIQWVAPHRSVPLHERVLPSCFFTYDAKATSCVEVEAYRAVFEGGEFVPRVVLYLDRPLFERTPTLILEHLLSCWDDSLRDDRVYIDVLRKALADRRAP